MDLCTINEHFYGFCFCLVTLYIYDLVYTIILYQTITIVSSFLQSMFSFHGQRIGCCIVSYPVHVRAIDAAARSFFNLVDSLLLVFKRFLQLKKAIINFGFCNVRYPANQSCEDVPTCMLQWHKRFTSFGSVSQDGRALNPT